MLATELLSILENANHFLPKSFRDAPKWYTSVLSIIKKRSWLLSKDLISIWPYCFSYNHFNDNYNYHGIIKEYITKLLNSLKPGKLLPCISSFNGLSIYRTCKFLETYYDGRVRSDIFPKEYIQSHAKAQKSRTLIYRDYGHIKGKYEDCEHRAFHQMARNRSNARIMISPEVLFY